MRVALLVPGSLTATAAVPRVYGPGRSWDEPPGALHGISANASRAVSLVNSRESRLRNKAADR